MNLPALASAVVLSAISAAAQSSPPPIGLLVGLSSGRTLWIAPQDGALRLVSAKQHLLVPRADGFWWVGTVQRCGVEEFDGGGMNITEAGTFLSRNESLFVTRSGDTARVTLDGVECDIAEREVTTKRAASARAYADSLARAGDSTALRELATDTTAADGGAEDIECSINTNEITFVSASAISVEQRQTTTEFCSPAKYYTSGGNVVLGFNSKKQIPLRPLLRPAERARIAKEFSSSGVCGFDEEMTEDHVDSAWAVRRVEGTWRATFFVDGPIACRGGTDVELSPELPGSFTGDTPLPLKWAELQRAMPTLRDAASDPTRTHLALIAGDTLSIVSVRNGRIGETLITVPVSSGEQFVMLRWATPAEIARWNRVITSLREPVVIVKEEPSQ